MYVNLIILFSMVVIWISMYYTGFTYDTSDQQKNQAPWERQTLSASQQEGLADYRRSRKKWFWGSGLTMLLILVPTEYVSYYFIVLLAWIVGVLAWQGVIQRRYEQYLESPEDCHWTMGMYYNPENPKVLVPRRYGSGWTVNAGRPAGKVILGVTALLVIGLCGLFLWDDLVPPKVVFGDTALEIQGSIYKAAMPYEDIEALTWLETLPKGSKANGSATARYARGHFILKDLGRVKVFVFKKSAPYLLIRGKDGLLLYSGPVPADTRQVYETLQDKITK